MNVELISIQNEILTIMQGLFKRNMAIYFYFDLSIRTFEVSVISIVKFLMTCLVSEILRAKTLVVCHLEYSKIYDDVTTGKLRSVHENFIENNLIWRQSKGLIPRQRNSLRELVYAKYRWLHMNNSIEFTLCEKKFRFASE